MMDGSKVSQDGAGALEKHLMALRSRFLGTLVEKEQLLEDAISSLAAYGQDRQIMSKVYYVAHNLVGIAPMHRLNSLAEAARLTEVLLAKAIFPPHEVVELDDVLIAIDDLVEEIRTNLETHLDG
ncbi:hypothetical protein Q8W37_02295 [Shimia thalassica]|jgi:hypothetical protein|uniref:hypothetical protein n=2 Tax=Shimia thalassica TaxID=1715693 RepID=UPI001C09B422|nr:hypothetical protein [Shimia thalassica]MBU2944360.1 hypothetical protein [Shimia thalassica]MDO6479410.1 hypothetical protein [Shimia thalassica]MDO6482672.1 hypothetical protein [Shimia thalassica]MDO6502295.1 hypothetical protein [Shimia thalassica]MDO6519983.1 hypothetical protein [Shimia thalassica]